MTFNHVTYAVGDIHGRYEILEAILKRIEAHRKSWGDETGEKTKIVFLGDYIDRGKRCRDTVARLMEGPRDQAEWVILKGNHEEMACLAHQDKHRYWAWWLRNGGLSTLMDYGGQRVPDDVLTWMSGLPTRHNDEHRFFCHAGIKDGDQSTETVLWVRHPRNHETPMKNKYIVHGHTPFMDGPVVLESRCNLDTAAYSTGFAAIAAFADDLPGKPFDMLEVRLGYDFSF